MHITPLTRGSVHIHASIVQGRIQGGAQGAGAPPLASGSHYIIAWSSRLIDIQLSLNIELIICNII